MLLRIFDFTADTYAWYVEMYIGLFLLIPFLNIIWNNLEENKRKYLIITMLILTSVPSIFNCWDFLQLGDRSYSEFMPNYWEVTYPITYYFLGAYLKDVKQKGSMLKDGILLLVTTILFGMFSYFRSFGGTYEWIDYNSFEGIQPVITTFLIFRLLLAIPTENMPDVIKKGVFQIAHLAFGIYLASNISDKIVAHFLPGRLPDTIEKMNWLPVSILCSFVISLVISLIVNGIYDIVEKTLSIAYRKIKTPQIH